LYLTRRTSNGIENEESDTSVCDGATLANTIVAIQTPITLVCHACTALALLNTATLVDIADRRLRARARSLIAVAHIAHRVDKAIAVGYTAV
jgi:hypothetical protein